MAATLAELARRFGGRLRGAGDVEITAVASLEDAGAGHISYVNDARHRRQLGAARASALILTETDAKDYAGNALIVDRPQLCFARIAAFLHPPPPVRPGIHAMALVDPRARISARASIGAFAVVEAGAVVDDDVEIGAGCYVGSEARIGAGTRAVGHVWVGARCVIGKRCLLQPGAVIGGDGFGFAKDGERWVRIPQLGRVVIGDDVEIGANTTIDRGTLSDTEIADGVKLDNLVQIAHNVRIGEHTAMAACVGVAGSSVIGRRCTFGGQVGVADHVTIADDVHVLGTSLVAASIGEAGMYSAAIPAEPAGEWRRQAARLRHLDELVERVKALEEEVNELKEDRT